MAVWKSFSTKICMWEAFYHSYRPRFFSFSFFYVDGMVVEFQHLTSLQGGLHYLLLPRLSAPILKPHYAFFKKHEDLTNNGIVALRHAEDHTIAYMDGGYHLLMTAMPKDHKKTDTRLLHRDLYSLMAAELLNSVIDNFRALIRGLTDKDVSAHHQKAECGGLVTLPHIAAGCNVHHIAL